MLVILTIFIIITNVSLFVALVLGGQLKNVTKKIIRPANPLRSHNRLLASLSIGRLAN